MYLDLDSSEGIQIDSYHCLSRLNLKSFNVCKLYFSKQSPTILEAVRMLQEQIPGLMPDRVETEESQTLLAMLMKNDDDVLVRSNQSDSIVVGRLRSDRWIEASTISLQN